MPGQSTNALNNLHFALPPKAPGAIAIPAIDENTAVATETTVCQVPGTSLRITATNFKKAIIGATPLRHLSECYFQAHISQVSQSVACNRMHVIEQRFARWLLITHDRVQGDEFNLTKEFIAMMLGVHRPSVTIVPGEFQKDDLIEYHEVA